MKTVYDVVRRPIITEKTSKLVEEGKYTFEVMQGTNKTEVKEAVEKIWSVNVVNVNIVNCPRKERKVGKYAGLRPQVRKAIVTLEKGQTISAFEI